MDQQRQSRAPLIIAIVLLLLPVMYVGSYLALVVPSGRRVPSLSASYRSRWHMYYYCLDSALPGQVFWPLEQLDRKLRPETWEGPSPDATPVVDPSA